VTTLDEEQKRRILADVKLANDNYETRVKNVLQTRHSLYEADAAYYKKRFPVVSEQSDFVSFDFWSTVQWALPSLMNNLILSDDALVIMGRSSEDVPRAEVLKELINFQIMTQNKGFILLWDWFTDALQYNLGAIKIWWKRELEWGEETAENMPLDRIAAMAQDPYIQIVSAEPPDIFGLCRCVYKVKRLKENRPVLESVPVSDLRWSPGAKNLQEANFVAQRKVVSSDHLRRQARAGLYDPDAVEAAIERGTGSDIIIDEFRSDLNDELASFRNDGEDPARQLHELYECFVKMDIDGDGFLEDCIATVAGEEVLRAEPNPYGRAPIFTISPVRDPFKVLSNLSFAEIIGEVQTLKIALIRQVLVNTVNVNNARMLLDETAVNHDDLLNNSQYIRTKGNPHEAVMPVPQAGLAPWTMNLLEHFDAVLEQWTGQTRYNQGMDSKSLNKTATGISLLTEASEKRMDYIVRVFAETGVSEAMRFLIELNQRYIDQPQVIRLKNRMLEVSPDDLSGEYDIDVNTEAGMGKRKQNIQNLQFYLSAIAPMGMQLGAVTPAEWAQAAQKLLSESGIRNPEAYVQDPALLRQGMVQQAMMALLGGMAGNGSGNGAEDKGQPGEGGPGGTAGGGIA
jgi:hypothetical protein